MIVKSLKELGDLLIANKVDLSDWGREGAKSVENLWNEICSGDTQLQYNPLARIVSVAQVYIRDSDNRLLIEIEQELADGRIRSRNQPPAEKMKPAENYIDAAARCLQEELGIERKKAKFLITTYRHLQQTKDSPSYPGLQTIYTFHIVDAEIQGLPISDFWTAETTLNEKDPVRQHHWDWVERK